MYWVRFLVALVCFAALGAGIYGIGHVAGCDTDQRPRLRREVVEGTAWLTHARGFRLIEPGPAFATDRAAAERVESLATSCDSYQGPAATLLVCVVDDPVESRGELDERVEAMKRGAAGAAETFNRRRPGYLTGGLERLAAGALTTLAETVHWNNGAGDAFLHLRTSGIDIRVQALTVRGGLVVVLAVGDGLDRVVASLARTTR